MKNYISLLIIYQLVSISAIAQDGWIRQSTPSDCGRFNDLHIFDMNTIIAVDHYGKIIKTTDGGNEWVKLKTDILENLYSVYFTSVDIGWAVGSNGTIIKTTNGGETWNYQTSGSNRQLNSLFFIDENRGWAVGSYRNLLQTIDGGATWENQLTEANLNFIEDIYFTSENEGLAVGSPGNCYRTKDGGHNWAKIDFGVAWLNDVYFIDKMNGFAAGITGTRINIWEDLWGGLQIDVVNKRSTVWKTVDGGENWEKIMLPFSRWVTDIFFIDHNFGWVVGEDGFICKTSNGGNNMATTELFGLALGLNEPWFVSNFQFDPEKRRLDLTIDFKHGAHFSCPECQKSDCTVHDTNTRTWRHLDFFQHQAYLSTRIPRIECADCGVKQVMVPWARPGSGFTLLFEIYTLLLAQQMAIAPLAKLLRIHPDSVWRILGHYVEHAVKEKNLSSLTRVGIDELAQKKGHEYITVFGDLNQSKVVFVADSRESSVIKAFHDYLLSKQVQPQQISYFCLDMWPAYLKGLEDHFKDSQLIFDRYHLMAKANLALDQVRREEAKEHEELKKTRYLWLKNKSNLSKKEKTKLTSLKQLNLKTARAYAIIESLREVWNSSDKSEAQLLLKTWFFWATHSRLEPIKEFAKTVRNHWDGILNIFDSYITNGVIEGLNNKIKTAMKRAYGFKTFEYLRTIIFMVAGKLALPTLC